MSHALSDERSTEFKHLIDGQDVPRVVRRICVSCQGIAHWLKIITPSGIHTRTCTMFWNELSSSAVLKTQLSGHLHSVMSYGKLNTLVLNHSTTQLRYKRPLKRERYNAFTKERQSVGAFMQRNGERVNLSKETLRNYMKYHLCVP